MQFINVFIKDFQGRACLSLLFVLFITFHACCICTVGVIAGYRRGMG